MDIAVAGEGAFGVKHLEAIPGVTVVSLVGGVAEATRETAGRFPHPALDLGP